MNITSTQQRIYVKEFDGKKLYSTSISRKIEDKWENMYISVQLPKETTLEDKTDIEITKGFISFYKNKEGLPQIKFVIQEFNIINIENKNYNDPFDQELPF